MDNSPLNNISLPKNIPPPKIHKEKIELTKEQQLTILNLWNTRPDDPPSLIELTEAAFGPTADSRSIQGRAVRNFLVTRDMKYSVEGYKKKKPVELTDEQKAFITQNAEKTGVLEMSKFLFKDATLTAVDMETRAVSAFIKSLSEQNPKLAEVESFDEVGYRPPRSIEQASARVNKYILNCITQEERNKNTKIQTCLRALIRCCHQQRFVFLMNQLSNTDDRELLEGRFISFVWDKPDLTEEEIDLYIF